MRLALDVQRETARDLLEALEHQLGTDSVRELLNAPQTDAAEIEQQRTRVNDLVERLSGIDDERARKLSGFAQHLVDKSVWLVGGDGWAYDIGYGGLDHVLASQANVNVLVLDTEVYSNTGGQQSKATPLAAAAKFATSGKAIPKKDLGLLAMSYGHVYVARVAFGAKDAQTVRAFVEAEAHPGPSLIIAYSPCIAHGYDLRHGAQQQKLAVASGAWPLMRFDPHRAAQGQPPLLLDSPHPTKRLREYMQNETRFRMVQKQQPKRYAKLVAAAERYATQHVDIYEQLAKMIVAPGTRASERSETRDGETQETSN
jgi:pyruvate-ferredoxin/flavodoxin oxidoreductase